MTFRFWPKYESGLKYIKFDDENWKKKICFRLLIWKIERISHDHN